MEKIIKILIMLSIFFSFFDGFIIRFGERSFIRCYVFIIILLFLPYIIYNYKNLCAKIKFLYQKTPFKYFYYFILFLLLTAVIFISTHKASILIFYYLISKLFLSAFICYFISANFIPKYLSIKKSIKILFVFTISAIIIALIGYIGDSYSILFIQNFVDFFSNMKGSIMTDTITGSARARGFFVEPSAFGQFILISSPILYKICLSKYKIFKNNNINKLIKISIIPLSLISVVLTKSPIIFIFMLVFVFCYFYKRIILFIKHFFIYITVSILTLYMFIYFSENISFKQTYLYRIVNTISSIKSFETFVEVEPSLASRVVSYINSYFLFIKKPFIGYGYDNARFFMLKQFLNSPVPLTQENITNINLAMASNQGLGFNKSLLFGLLVETGLIGTFLYFLFLYKHIRYINKLIPYFYGVERKFLEGLRLSIIIVIATSFYNSCFATAYVYLYCGFVCSFVTKYYLNKRNCRYIK